MDRLHLDEVAGAEPAALQAWLTDPDAPRTTASR